LLPQRAERLWAGEVRNTRFASQRAEIDRAVPVSDQSIPLRNNEFILGRNLTVYQNGLIVL
jgi:hypothetical protein